LGISIPRLGIEIPKGEGNSLSLYLQTLLLVVRKFFIGSREVFCYRFERGIEKNVIFVT